MNFNHFYKESNQQLVDAMVSMWASGHPTEQQYLRKMFEKEPLVARPVFQTIFPWELSKCSFMEHATHLNILDEAFTTGLSTPADKDCEEFVFPASRCPYTHQTASWKAMLNDHKTIVVTSGTGSGKTECFMIPVLQDLYREKLADHAEGVQAIFLYPLNALMKNQQKRIESWCKSLKPNVTYAIYNGDMPDTGNTTGKYPQIVTRTQLRNTPPQILFTNPTMLNYMMVRSEDQAILQKSKGKLRWILLDEAHTYSGSSAAELSLQIRQVLEAFDVTIDQVNFAVTSATIGDPNDPAVRNRLKKSVCQLTGKPVENIEVITGSRIIPKLNTDLLKTELKAICSEFGGNVSVKEAEHLRELLNKKPGLEADTIANYFKKKLPIERQLELIDRLATKVMGLGADGSEQAILPVRGHFFIRSINGVYACPNTKCPSSKDGSLDLGTFTTYQNVNCPSCGSHLLEVASCSDCGNLVLVGENDSQKGYRMKIVEHSLEDQLFDTVDEDEEENSEEEMGGAFYSYFAIGKSAKPCPRTTAKPHYITLDTQNNKIHNLEHLEDAGEEDNVYREVNDGETNAVLCPYCGCTAKQKLHFLRASATFMGRILATTILDNAQPMEDSEDRDILYDGRKFIAFTDSRQGTAKSAMTTNQEVERNWIRTAIFHKLAEKRAAMYHPGGSLSNEEQQAYDDLIPKDGKLIKLYQDMLDNLKAKMAGNSIPPADSYPWIDLEHELEANISLKHLFHHLREAKKNALLSWSDPVMQTDISDYLNSLYFDQFSWIPKRSNSLETMGLVHLVYPAIQRAQVPDELGRLGYTDKDWQDYIKICVDYVVRSNKHIHVPEKIKDYTLEYALSKPIYGPDCKLKSVPKWPVFEGSPSKVNEKQSRVVLLLCSALGFDAKDTITPEQRTLVDGLLVKAWSFVRDNVLFVVDDSQKSPTDYGYKLNILDPEKVRLQLITEGWVCPVDNVIVDTLFRGYSPRLHGYLNKTNFERFKITTDKLIYPFYPYANAIDPNDKSRRVSNDEIDTWMQDNMSAQRDAGMLNQLVMRVYEKHQIYLAGEHSAQQQRAILDQYEDDFNKGHMNILSCSTTMEMGVDLKGISAVVMNTVPPKPANYLQRAGRAGRRGESKALALTFCNPSPIGMNTWKHPLWPMEHQTETPQIKLESRQIVQRHVNSFFFAKFIQAQGGIKVKASIEDFFSDSTLYYQQFYSILQKLRSDAEAQAKFETKYRALVKGTCMGEISLSDAATTCIMDLNHVHEVYKNRLSALDASMTRAEALGGRVLAAVTRRKTAYLSSALLPYLAEHNFIPSAGIPTGLVEFIPDLYPQNQKNRKAPTQHLSQAISNYAPGKQVILNEWCYEAKGIVMKSKFEETKKDVLQSCSNCGYSLISIGSPIKQCPKCGQMSMHGVRGLTHDTTRSNFTEIIEPAGFSVDWAYKPNRRLRTASSMNLIQPILLEMDPWSERQKGTKIIMRTSQPQSEILFYNKGNAGLGYALCPYCGRMESEKHVAGDDHDENPLLLHKNLETGEHCEGTDNNGSQIRRNVLLVGRYQTDFVEVKFYDSEDREVTDQDTLYSLGVIISRKLTEVLGVNEGEIDFGYNPYYSSIFIYDTALGGAGYSPLLREYKNRVLDACYESLERCHCEQACTNCLIDRQSQWYINYLNRNKALEWLVMEQETRKAPASVAHIFPDASVITSDFMSEFFQITNDNNVQSVDFFINPDVSKWEIEEFAFLKQIDTMRAKGAMCRFILPVAPSLKTIKAQDITRTMSVLFRNQFAVGSIDAKGQTPLMLLTMNDGHQTLYFGDSLVTDLNKKWGTGTILCSPVQYDVRFQPLSPSTIMEEIMRGDGNVVFEFYVFKRQTFSSKLFATIMENEAEKWEKVVSALNGKRANIVYSDKYVRNPLACFIVANMLGQIFKECNLQVNSLSFQLDPMDPDRERRSYSRYEPLLETFSSLHERNELLKACIDEYCHKVPSITTQNQQHYRSLLIETDDYECSIRPDAGFAWGWSLERTRVGMELEDLTDDLVQIIPLYNWASNNSGILYTVALKKK